LFLILVGRARAAAWEVGRNHRTHHLERKTPMPYVNHYSFHILDPDWGHITIKISGHPPFPAQVMLNGHEYVACQARRAGIRFSKEGNCFTHISDAAGLAKIADTLSEQRTIGRLRRVCERWIYTTCLCFALDLDEQRQSGFRYQYSNYQIEYSRNLLFEVGGHMEQCTASSINDRRIQGPTRIKSADKIRFGGVCLQVRAENPGQRARRRIPRTPIVLALLLALSAVSYQFVRNRVELLDAADLVTNHQNPAQARLRPVQHARY